MKKFCISVCLLLLCATGEAQTLTSVGTAAVASANDFATTAFQDPWDMNERTDLGWFLNGVDQPGSAFTSVSFANGIFSGTSAGRRQRVPARERQPECRQRRQDRPKLPDRREHSPADRLPRQHQRDLDDVLQWNRDTIYDTTTTRSNTITTTPGFRFYLADLPTLGTTPIGTPAPFAWAGTVKSLWMFFNAAGSVSLDWVRLVDVQPSLCRTITWSSGSVNIYLDDNASAADGNLGPIALNVSGGGASPGCSTSGANSYTFYAGALAPGTYHVVVATNGFQPE